MYPVAANYSHENMFKHLPAGERVDTGDNSTVHRQARIDALPVPRSAADVARILGDTADAAFPVYRDITLTTMVLDGATGVLDVWVDANPATAAAGPDFSWNLTSFFVAAPSTPTLTPKPTPTPTPTPAEAAAADAAAKAAAAPRTTV